MWSFGALYLCSQRDRGSTGLIRQHEPEFGPGSGLLYAILRGSEALPMFWSPIPNMATVLYTSYVPKNDSGIYAGPRRFRAVISSNMGIVELLHGICWKASQGPMIGFQTSLVGRVPPWFTWRLNKGHAVVEGCIGYTSEAKIPALHIRFC